MTLGHDSTITLLAIGLDSDVAVYEQPDGRINVEWDAEKSGDLNIAEMQNMGEAVLLLDQLQGAGYKVPFRFVKELAINAISQLLEGKENDNLKAE
jgi:hypothetical protein